MSLRFELNYFFYFKKLQKKLNFIIECTFNSFFWCEMKKILTMCVSLFFFIDASLQANSENDSSETPSEPEVIRPIPLANTEGHYSTLICGCVNAITGDYIDSHVDIVVPGPEPIIFERHYCSSAHSSDTLGFGWGHNFDSHISEPPGKNSRQLDPLEMDCKHRSGITTTFTGKTRNAINNFLSFDVKKNSKGLTNCAQKISGRTNIKNQWINYSKLEKAITLVTGSGNRLWYVKRDPNLCHSERFFLVKECMANGNCLHYSYDKTHCQTNTSATPMGSHLRVVTAHDKTKSIVYGSITLTEAKEEKKRWPHHFVTSSTGKKVDYYYTWYKKQRDYFKGGTFYLTSVIHADGGFESFEYEGIEMPSASYSTVQKEYFLKKKILPDGRFLGIEYYKWGNNEVMGINAFLEINNWRVGRVRKLWAPVGVGGAPIATAQFIYDAYTEPGFTNILHGGTEVRDAYNHKVAYGYSKEHRLIYIHSYTGTDNHQLYSTRRFYWGTPDSGNEDRLVGQSLEDYLGHIHWHHSFSYDVNGNVTQSILTGNLTGSSPQSIPLLNDYPTGGEQYYKTYLYSDSKYNLLLEQSELGVKTISYGYLPNSDLLTSKLLYEDNRIKERHFYTYDACGVVVEEIIDDGNTSDKNSLSGVTERHIKRIVPTKDSGLKYEDVINTRNYLPEEIFGKMDVGKNNPPIFPQRIGKDIVVQPYNKVPVGLPEEVIDLVLDMTTNKEILVKRTVNAYSKEGNLLKRDVYDSNNKFAYTLSWEYDLKGNVILERNALGETKQSRYDANNNLIYVQGPHPDYRKEMTYDYANRLIRIDEFHSNNCHTSESYSYDYLGNRICSVDKHGYSTYMSYDEFGRVIQTVLPSVMEENGAFVSPTSQIVKYTPLGMPEELCDAKGNITHIKYTIRGSPYEIRHPDGTSEKKVYNLKGTLRKKVDRDGTITLYHYDYKDRVTATEIYDPSGQLLRTTTSVYNAFHLLREKDSAGHVTHYSYDPVGRLKEATKENARKTFSYDSLGRLTKMYDYYGSEPKDVKCTFQYYDLRNRVVEEGVQDYAGNVLKSTRYRYDVLGNRTHIIQADGATAENVYDSRGFIIKTIDPLGNTSHTTYDDNYIDSYGQRVLNVTSVDALGTKSEVIHDTHHRPCLFLRWDAFGALVAKRELRYDRLGNVVHTIDSALSHSILLHEVTTTMEYDQMHRMIAMTEAVGTPEQRITHYTYHKTGKKASAVKPDGNSLLYDYDFLGRMTTCADSAGTFSYSYSYDANNNLIGVADLLNNTQTTRNYDSNDRLIKEKLANGLTIAYEYDFMGRPTRIVLPDESSSQYSYDAAFLQSIEKYDSQGMSQYKHQYTKYNANGYITETELAGHAGHISYKYDALGRLTEQKAPQWSQRNISYDAMGNLLGYEQQDAQSHIPIVCSFTYDSLYQLSGEEGMSSHHYEHDSLHNRLKKDTQNYVINHLNQILQRDQTEYRDDPNGNLISKEGFVYQYDGMDRLVKVLHEGEVIEYTYDAFNRRMSKRKGGTEVKYLYTGQDDIGAVENDKITELRLLGIGKGAEIGAAVMLEIDNIPYVPIHDKMGNIASLLDMNGNTLVTHHYSAFGETVDDPLSWPIVCPWRFSSKRHDPETGLVYFGRRYYDPADGRWITTDPSGYDAGPNLYAYVKNSPTINCDLYGLVVKAHDEDSRVRDQLIENCNRNRERAREERGGNLPHYAYESSTHDSGDFHHVEQQETHHREQNWFDKAVCFILTLPGHILELVGEHCIFVPGVRDVVSMVGSGLAGEGWDWNPCWHRPHSDNFPMEGNMNEFNGIVNMCITGIMNTKEDALKAQASVSEANGGAHVFACWGANKGFMTDIVESALLILGIPTHNSEKILAQIKEGLLMIGEDGFVTIYAHSRGAAALDVAMKSLTDAEKSHINIVTFGGAKLIENGAFNSVVNYVCTRDIVPFIADPIGCIKAMFSDDTNVVFLSSDGYPLIDHAFLGDTYRDALTRYAEKAQKTYGHPVMP